MSPVSSPLAFLIRSPLRLLTRAFYRITVVGQAHMPSHGPALLVCNHVSDTDGLIVVASLPRLVQVTVPGPHAGHRALRWLLRTFAASPAGSGHDNADALVLARRALDAGHVACLFPEGDISRTGTLLPFGRGFERAVDGLDVPIVPVYLDRGRGRACSRDRNRFLWKMPRRVPLPVTVAFGAPLPAGTTAAAARLAVQTLGASAVAMRYRGDVSLGRAFIRAAKRQWGAFCLADATRGPLTRGDALVGALLLSTWIRRQAVGQTHVAVLLPSSVGGALANVAIALAGKASVNLNFTAGPEAMAAAVTCCGIRTTLTSRVFLERLGLPADDTMVFIEDVVSSFGRFAKLRTWIAARLLPAWLLDRGYASRKASGGPATVVFSSGTTGVPKGVMLTDGNILSNVDAVRQVLDFRVSDVIVGVLPLFHSFGFTGTLWLPLLAGFGVVYHANPNDARTIGDLAERYRGTTLISTPTFCRTYVRQCQPEQFAHLRYAIVGAEKLQNAIASAFREKFGLDLLEGYGCTEMAPVVSVNRPDEDGPRGWQRGRRAGTVGHPVPGVAAKIVHPDTGEGPVFGGEGLLLLTGPNQMAGYMGDEDATRRATRDGWYVTGDIAAIDEDGFIRITDRLSRFSKVGGEMVPHLRIEEYVNAMLADSHASIAIGIPDEARGERIVVLFTDPDLPAVLLWDRLCRTDLPRLWLPRREDVVRVVEIPVLGTGKTDVRAARRMAMERV